MGITVSQLSALDPAPYWWLACAFSDCETSLLAFHQDFTTKVTTPLADPTVWDGTIPDQGRNVAHAHAQTAHHSSDEMAIGMKVLMGVYDDLTSLKAKLKALETEMEPYAAFTDDGTPELTPAGVRAVQANYQDPTKPLPAQLTNLDYDSLKHQCRTILDEVDLIDTNAGRMLRQVAEAPWAIFVDTSNTMTTRDVDASPPGCIQLLGLLGDPAHDLETDLEQDAEFREQLEQVLRGLELDHSLTDGGMKDLISFLKGSDDPNVRAAATQLEKSPELLTNKAWFTHAPKGLAVAEFLVSAYGYEQQTHNPALSALEAFDTVAAGAVAAGTMSTALSAAAGCEVLGGGPEDPFADGCAGLAIVIGGISTLFGLAATDATGKVIEKLNEHYYGEESGSKNGGLPDPLELDPKMVDNAASGRLPKPPEPRRLPTATPGPAPTPSPTTTPTQPGPAPSPTAPTSAPTTPTTPQPTPQATPPPQPTPTAPPTPQPTP